MGLNKYRSKGAPLKTFRAIQFLIIFFVVYLKFEFALAYEINCKIESGPVVVALNDFLDREVSLRDEEFRLKTVGGSTAKMELPVFGEVTSEFVPFEKNSQECAPYLKFTDGNFNFTISFAIDQSKAEKLFANKKQDEFSFRGIINVNGSYTYMGVDNQVSIKDGKKASIIKCHGDLNEFADDLKNKCPKVYMAYSSVKSNKESAANSVSSSKYPIDSVLTGVK